MQKSFFSEEFNATVIVSRRKGTKHIRIALKQDGSIRLSVPYGIPELFAKQYLLSKKDWILHHKKTTTTLYDGMRIGKSHTLHFENTSSGRSTTRIANQTITVYTPSKQNVTDKNIQNVATKACEKALTLESNSVLIARLEQLSKKHGIHYRSASIKKMRSRWGMCDNKHAITLNIFLIQLPWNLIDYVICHELAHTIHPNHQANFWKEVAKMDPDYINNRKTLRTKSTQISETVLQ